MVAHDLRSPLSGISGISKMMLADDKVVEDNKEMFRLIEQSAESALRLISDLMHTNINSVEQYHFNPIELNKLVHQILQILVFTAKEKNIQSVRK